ncbi:MAG TPA: NAD(P)-dependent oxidoreductase [Mesorhizobium sp.]|jgi:hypothetical protein|nr:NAD(P)-dependent oxidoreductase [Mesorhizobium sp.]
MSQGAADKPSVGFVGLGLMGHGMAKNIVEKGFPLSVLAHRRRDAVEDLKARGASETADAAELAASSDIVVLCVTGSPQVEAIVRGPGGLGDNLAEGAVIVDCSTSDPTSTDALRTLLVSRGIKFVDAPLSRTPKEAWDGTLDVMVGAEPATLERVRPVLECFAGRIVHVGGPGDGHRMKLLNNFVSLGYAAIYAEALALARKVGISPERFDGVIRGGRMDCSFYQTFMRWTLERDRNAHPFTITNALKDLRYLEAMADAAGLANPLGNAAKNAFAMAAAGDGAEDFVPMLVDHVARANGVEPD